MGFFHLLHHEHQARYDRMFPYLWVYAAVLALAGFVMDTLAGRVGPKELLGLCLVGAGVWWNNRQSQAARPPEGEAAA